MLVGLPALRIQGLFLAVATLGFAFAAEGFILKREFFGWMLPKEGGYIERPLIYGSIDLKNDSELFGITVPADAKFYWLCLLVLGLVVALAKSLRKNRSGRVLIAARDNGRLVQAFGVNLAATRLAAFAASGFIAGLAGGLIAYQNQGFEPGGFTPEKSLTLFVMAVIGGVGSIPGAILGAVYVVGLPLLPGLSEIELDRPARERRGLLFLLMFMPGGLIEGVYRVRDNLLRRVASKHGIHVPSLVADSLVTEEEEGLLLDDPTRSTRRSKRRSTTGHRTGGRCGLMRKRLEAITGGEPIGPLVVLFGLNLVDELDRLAFGIMGPDIGETFGIDDGDVIIIATLVRHHRGGASCRCRTWPTGSTASGSWRSRRCPGWLSACSPVWPAGLALLGILVVARLGAGIGRAVNEPVHSSLLPDYYPAEHLPKVFTFHRIANPLSAVTAVFIGGARPRPRLAASNTVPGLVVLFGSGRGSSCASTTARSRTSRRSSPSCVRSRRRRSPTCSAPTCSGWRPSRVATPRARHTYRVPETPAPDPRANHHDRRDTFMTTAAEQRTPTMLRNRPARRKPWPLWAGTSSAGPTRDAAGATAQRGLSEAVVRDISAKKGEPEWMLESGSRRLRLFDRKPMPNWGADLSGIDFDTIKYFVRSTEKQAASWEDLPEDIKNTYDRLGIPEGGESTPGCRRRRPVRVRGRLPQDPRGPREAGRDLPGHGHRAQGAP